MNSSSRRRSEGLKIVQIETRYVETDAKNFSAVVQSLTGKNSSTAWVGGGGSSPAAAGVEITKGGVAQDSVTVKSEQGVRDGNEENVISSTTLKNMSSKDFDRLLSELPPLEDLPWL